MHFFRPEQKCSEVFGRGAYVVKYVIEIRLKREA